MKTHHEPALSTKGNMRNIAKMVFGFAAAVTLVILSGCATSEKPNYQGHKGASPTVDDYYPKTNAVPNR